MTGELYKIVRYRQFGRNSVLKRGLTLAQAQKHCKRSDTVGVHAEHGQGWFDGYELEGNDDPLARESTVERTTTKGR